MPPSLTLSALPETALSGYDPTDGERGKTVIVKMSVGHLRFVKVLLLRLNAAMGAFVFSYVVH